MVDHPESRPDDPTVHPAPKKAFVRVPRNWYEMTETERTAAAGAIARELVSQLEPEYPAGGEA
jgi:hypothetical protein